MNYTADKIFQNPAVNTFIDNVIFRSIAYLTANFPLVDIKTVFALSGKAAAILQGETLSEVNNIIFVVTSEELFSFLKTMDYPLTRRIVFQEKVLFYHADAFFEFHLVESFTKVDYNSISLQLDSEIITEFL
jgi:hypothetical protein